MVSGEAVYGKIRWRLLPYLPLAALLVFAGLATLALQRSKLLGSEG